MVYELYLLLWLLEVACNGWFESLWVHIPLELQPVLIVLFDVFDVVQLRVLWCFKFAYLGVLKISDLPRVVNVEVELVRVETKSLHIF